MRPDGPRDLVAGPDSGPEPPFPIRLSGPVIKGFGRGSKELGIPTANIPPDGLSEYPDLKSGVYYGVAALDPAKFVYDRKKRTGHILNGDGGGASNRAMILPAVLSIGYNPFFHNTIKSVEVHIMSPLSLSSSPSPPVVDSEPEITCKPGAVSFYKLPDFYSTTLNLLILGYIRPEYDYVSLDALVEDIRIDCEVARLSLTRDAYSDYLEENDDNVPVGRKAQEHRNWVRTFA